VNFLSKISLVFTLKRSLVAIPFALAAVTIMFTLPGDSLASFTIGNWDLSISDAGFVRFISILLRSWLSIQAAILLTATTKFPDMAHSLRHLGTPLILITIISFMYRYIFVLSDEAVRLIRARKARSAQKPGQIKPPIAWHARITGNMIGQLFLRSYERSDRVYNAMLARGFQGEFLTLTPHKMTDTDWVAFFTALCSILLLQLITHL
jgi:cobalt/nickel transport system permease protein